MEKSRIENENAWLREELIKFRPELSHAMIVADGGHSQPLDGLQEAEELNIASSPEGTVSE